MKQTITDLNMIAGAAKKAQRTCSTAFAIRKRITSILVWAAKAYCKADDNQDENPKAYNLLVARKRLATLLELFCGNDAKLDDIFYPQIFPDNANAEEEIADALGLKKQQDPHEFAMKETHRRSRPGDTQREIKGRYDAAYRKIEADTAEKRAVIPLIAKALEDWNVEDYDESLVEKDWEERFLPSLVKALLTLKGEAQVKQAKVVRDCDIEFWGDVEGQIRNILENAGVSMEVFNKEKRLQENHNKLINALEKKLENVAIPLQSAKQRVKSEPLEDVTIEPTDPAQASIAGTKVQHDDCLSMAGKDGTGQMATMFPELTDDQLEDLSSKSQAEAKVYRALRDGLPRDFVVFHSVWWILRREEGEAKDGEADFVVCHPDFGYVCIEVKGGGIRFDASSGNWFSVDRHQEKHDIKDPGKQAKDAKFSILSKLKEHPRWKDLSLPWILTGHAVFFPDIGNVNDLTRPDMPPALIGCAKDVQNPKPWIDAVFAYWNNASEFTPLGKRGIELFREVFARSFEVAPLISSQLAEQEVRRLKLTEDQIRLLDFLRSHRRVAVSGGAGTGKTVLALEKARRLASEGFKTLLTCYNEQLAKHLSSLCKGIQNLDVMTFHKLCHRQIQKANQASGLDLLSEARLTYPGKDEHKIQLPHALLESVCLLPDRYDAIVCDEGQDFSKIFWDPLELLLANSDTSPLYVFYDDNQNLYGRKGTFPIHEAPFLLTSNCRNTAQIHEAAYKYYKGDRVNPPDNWGDDVRFIESPSRDSQATKINAYVVDLIAKQDVKPGDITVLIADSFNKDKFYEALKALKKNHPLPKSATWLEEGLRGETTILMDTIQRFKGLESDVVILWGLDTDLSQLPELLYVGMSRAKSMLIIVGKAETCAKLKQTGC